MKKTKLLIALLVLLGAASLAEAQIVVSSTNASTTRIVPRSGREKGFVIRPEIEAGWGIYELPLLVGITGTASYQINPYFAFGGGLGYEYDYVFYDEMSPYPSWMPIFVNARAYFCDRKWSPFLDLKIGYNIPITKGLDDYGERDWSLETYGFTIGGTIGVQYKCFDYGITGRTLKVFRDNDYFPNDDMNLGSVTISVAYNFQFKK